MTDKLPSLMDVINPDNQKTEQTQNLNEINSEKPKEEKKEIQKESEIPNEKIEEPPKEILSKTEMCQLIYYDFSVK